MSKVFVVGDWILDQTTRVTVRGVSPESDNVLVLNQRGQPEYGLGGAANVAANVAGLGGDVLTIGSFGRDEEARIMERLFDTQGIPYWCLTHDGPTTLKHRVFTPSGQYVRIDREDAKACKAAAVDWQRSVPRGQLLSQVRPGHVLCLVDYDKGFCVTDLVFDLVEAACAHDCPLLVDPGRSGDWDRYGSRQTVLKVNLKQAQSFCARHLHPFKTTLDPHELYDGSVYLDLIYHVNRVAKRKAVYFSHLWVTLGAGGMAFASPTTEPTLIPHRTPLQVADVCGAGDTAMATLAFHLARSGSDTRAFHEGIGLANNAAGVAVQKKGVHVARVEDLTGVVT